MTLTGNSDLPLNQFAFQAMALIGNSERQAVLSLSGHDTSWQQ